MPQSQKKPALVTSQKPSSGLMNQARGQVQDRLSKLFDAFLAEATYEEKYFLAAVLDDWEGQANPSEGPALYTAIQLNLS